MSPSESYAAIPKGKASPDPESRTDDSGSGNVRKTPETVSIRKGEAATTSMHGQPQVRAVSHRQPQYLLFDSEKLTGVICSSEKSAGEALSENVLVGMDEVGDFTFHSKKNKKNRALLNNFSTALVCCLHRRSKIEGVLCGFSSEKMLTPDFFNVGLVKNFLELQKDTPVITYLYQCEVRLSKYCHETTDDRKGISACCHEVSKILKGWYSPAEDKAAYRQYIKSFIDRSTVEFQGNDHQIGVLHSIQSDLEKVLDCAETETVSGLVSPEQRLEQASAIESEMPELEGAVGFQGPLSTAAESEDIALIQSMEALGVESRTPESIVEDTRSVVVRPKSKKTGKIVHRVDIPVEVCDANSVLTEEILCEQRPLNPMFDAVNLLGRVNEIKGQDNNTFVCLNKEGGVRFVNKLKGGNQEDSLQFGKSLREYEVWARVVFDFFHSQHDFYKGKFKNIERGCMQVRTCRSVLSRYAKHPYSSVLRTTFLLFKAVQEGRQAKVEQFSGILGRMISVFVKHKGGVNQSGSLATIAESGRVFCFFESALKRCQRIQPEWQTELNIVREHFNNSLKALGVKQRLS